VSRPALEVADIFRDHGATWRSANAGHVSLGQLKVMSAIERCRTAALGGHVARCEKCAHTLIAYNPAATGTARSVKARRLRSGSPRARSTYCRYPTSTWSSRCRPRSPTSPNQNKTVIYDILFRASAETME
jgi:hypothetical protein